MPILDVPTRWNSSYLMLKKVFELKQFCEEHLDAGHQLTPSEWAYIQNIGDVLSPVYKTTLTLQKEQLLLGDFYKVWLEQKLAIKAINGEMAKKLFDRLEEREKNLLENITICAALYLDPRFRRLLSNEKKN